MGDWKNMISVIGKCCFLTFLANSHSAINPVAQRPEKSRLDKQCMESLFISQIFWRQTLTLQDQNRIWCNLGDLFLQKFHPLELLSAQHLSVVEQWLCPFPCSIFSKPSNLCAAVLTCRPGSAVWQKNQEPSKALFYLFSVITQSCSWSLLPLCLSCLLHMHVLVYVRLFAYEFIMSAGQCGYNALGPRGWGEPYAFSQEDCFTPWKPSPILAVGGMTEPRSHVKRAFLLL